MRVLVFPSRHIESAKAAMLSAFPTWEANHVLDEGQTLAWKYHGFCPSSLNVRCEYQIVPMLVGLFWDVEHAALYKPDRELIGVAREPLMRERTSAVLRALSEFEQEFVRQVAEAGQDHPGDALGG